MRSVEYKSRGVPLEDYELTRRDHRWQKDLENIRRVAHAQVSKHLDEVYADPELTAAHQEQLRKVWKFMESAKAAPHDIMRWRVRLYCEHIVTTSRHAENAEPTLHGSSSMKCPECGKDPSAIVAFEPIGLAGEPPRARATTPPAQRKPSRVELERRIAQLEEENRRLRTEKST
ncbi:hypothetical protein ACWV2X_01705 [Streptomyces hydrogenans]